MQESAGACALAVTGIELDSLITSVRDLLPDLGEGFIEVTWTLVASVDYMHPNVLINTSIGHHKI